MGDIFAGIGDTLKFLGHPLERGHAKTQAVKADAHLRQMKNMQLYAQAWQNFNAMEDSNPQKQKVAPYMEGLGKSLGLSDEQIQVAKSGVMGGSAFGGIPKGWTPSGGTYNPKTGSFSLRLNTPEAQAEKSQKADVKYAELVAKLRKAEEIDENSEESKALGRAVRNHPNYKKEWADTLDTFFNETIPTVEEWGGGATLAQQEVDSNIATPQTVPTQQTAVPQVDAERKNLEVTIKAYKKANKGSRITLMGLKNTHPISAKLISSFGKGEESNSILQAIDKGATDQAIAQYFQGQ